jgi:hypothetical protein
MTGRIVQHAEIQFSPVLRDLRGICAKVLMPGYRHRWAILERFQIVKHGGPYLDRVRLVQTPLGSLYLHRIHTEDGDEFPHDHPWWFASLVLSGRYTECVYANPSDLNDTRIRNRPRGSLRRLSRHEAHKITKIDGKLRTLVLAGPHHQTWRFWTADGPVDWQSMMGKCPESSPKPCKRY